MGKKEFSKKWRNLLKSVDYAFQPIVNIYTGKTYAFEALMRNIEDTDFQSIDDVFNQAYEEEIMFALDLELRAIALRKFQDIPFYMGLKLFYNLDNRISTMSDYTLGATQKICGNYGINLKCEDLCFELSEKNQEDTPYKDNKKTIKIYKSQNYKVAIDDFGTGYSGLKMLYNIEPNFVKIDRFFISNIQKDQKKQIFVKSIVEVAQSIGTSIIAEGVETREEFLVCKELGCNMAQGFFIAKPKQNLDVLQKQYEHIKVLQKIYKRSNKNETKSIKSKIERLQCVHAKTKISVVLELFKTNKQLQLVPIVGYDGTPLGVVKESVLKDYTYSPYGWSLLENNTRKNILAFATSCSMVDINDNLDKILKIYTYNRDSEGVLVTRDGVYFGFLSAKELLNLVSKKNILAARDQNPLTKLPGNVIISEFISSVITSAKAFNVVYFDLDNFKAFNDYYGFRNGDRVIKLFGEIVQKASLKITSRSLVGHIGGDDFFLGWQLDKTNSFEQNYIFISTIIRKFALQVESFYNKEDREAGYITAKNRKGEKEKFPLMSVSAAMLTIRDGIKNSITMDEIGEVCAKLKKHAKNNGGNTAIAASL